MPAMTSAASAICGTRSARTKLVTSTFRKPQPDSMSTRRILSAAGMTRVSFCRPSRGPTSYTWAKSVMPCLPGRLQRQQNGTVRHLIALTRENFGDPAVTRCGKRKLHLHRLHHRQRLSHRDGLSGGDAQELHETGHRGRYPVPAADISVLSAQEIIETEMPVLPVPED